MDTLPKYINEFVHIVEHFYRNFVPISRRVMYFKKLTIFAEKTANNKSHLTRKLNTRCCIVSCILSCKWKSRDFSAANQRNDLKWISFLTKLPLNHNDKFLWRHFFHCPGNLVVQKIDDEVLWCVIALIFPGSVFRNCKFRTIHFSRKCILS